MQPNIRHLPNSPFLRKMTSADLAVFLISTHCLSKFSDQSESVFHLFLVSYWLNVLLFPVSYGGERSSGCSRKTARITSTVLQRKKATVTLTAFLKKATEKACHCWCDKTAALSGFLLHPMHIPPQLENSKRQFEAS
jgi:hypothetical protein